MTICYTTISIMFALCLDYKLLPSILYEIARNDREQYSSQISSWSLS